MKAIVCKKLGPPEELVLEDTTTHAIGTDEVRIHMEATNINFPNVLIIQNKYQVRNEPPFTPNSEIAKTIIEISEHISKFKPDDHVATMYMIDNYTEETIAIADAYTTIPENMSTTHTASFPIVYNTTIHTLIQHAAMKPNETLLVLGTADDIDLTTVQLNKLLNARIIATTSSDEKLAFCREQNTDATMNYEKENLKEAMKRLTDSNGADIIYDPIGNKLALECFSCIAWAKRFLMIGFASDTIPEVPLNRLLIKNASTIDIY